MRIFASLTFRLLLAICASLLILTLVMLVVTNQQVRTILDQSKSEYYQRQIDMIINNLKLQEERLQATGLPDSYRHDFQNSTVRNLRATYYLRSDAQRAPVIFTLDGRVVMHPRRETGQSMAGDGWALDRIAQLKNGQFVHSHDETGQEWHIFKLFRPWNWVVGYAVPLSVKYAEADRLLRYLTLTFLIILAPVAAILSLFIRRELKPVKDLTRAAEQMGSGEPDYPLPSGIRGELGTLSHSFSQMRDLIRSELKEREQRAERRLRQQQALLTLSRSKLAMRQDTSAFLRLVAEQVEQTLGCGRVSIWQFDPQRERLHCKELYIAGQGHGDSEQALSTEDYPSYFAAILSGQVVAAEDVRKDPRTLSFAAEYLDPEEIHSMLDVPIRVTGETRGVICIENIGAVRRWHEDDITFVSSVAEQIAQALTQVDNRRAAEEISRLRRELANIVNSMPSILIGVDRQLRVRHWNREAENATGLSSEQVHGAELAKAFPLLGPQADLITAAMTEKQLQTRRKLSWPLNGRQVFIDLTVYPLLDEKEPGTVIRIDDVTERVQLEEMMVQTEKMLSVGGLAAGMAHEINNPLAAIMQNIQVIRNRFNVTLARNVEAAEACGTSMETIAAYIEKRGMLPMFDSLTESGSRAARIVDNMLSFSRKSESLQAPHDLNDLIGRTLDLAGNDYDLKQSYDFRKIELIRDEEESMPEVPCTATEIQQVLLNLLKNSAQAMAADPECVKPQIRICTHLEDRHAVIELHDNGPGIPEEVRRRIFEPFFTTKGVGIGTGLGLSVSYFIIREKHRGSLEVRSKPGEGTSFYIRLPLRPDRREVSS